VVGFGRAILEWLNLDRDSPQRRSLRPIGRAYAPVGGRRERIKENIGHPDEIEKKKHFIGQADPHGRTQTFGLRPVEIEKLKAQRGGREGRRKRGDRRKENKQDQNRERSESLSQGL